MFKLILIAAICTVAFAVPVPDAKADPEAKPDPQFLAYTAPVVAAPAAVAYTADAYGAPIAYSPYVATPSVYAAGYTAYDPLTGSYVVL